MSLITVTDPKAMITVKTLLLPSFENTVHDRPDGVIADHSPDYDLAVVIDVLRATSVMVTALNAGAKNIITCGTIEQARDLSQRSPIRSILCGERNCKRIEGFDLGNSPSEYTRERVAGKQVILTTSNGTRAIESMQTVSTLVIASFLNISSVVNRIASANSVCIVCAGTNGEVTAEDVLLAGAIVSRLRAQVASLQVDDASELAANLWRSQITSKAVQDAGSESLLLANCLCNTLGGKNLLSIGYGDDLSVCSRIDLLSGVPTRSETSDNFFTFDLT